MDCILVRYGEISLKSDFVRAEFERLLMQNISEALVRNSIAVEKITKHGARIYVFCKQLEKAMVVLQNVFGIVSISPTHIIKNDIEVFKEWALKIYREEAGQKNLSFRITSKRQEKTFPIDSQEIGRLVGEYVFEKTGAPVDLHNPDININFEVTGENTYLFAHTYRGWAGLPIGSQGRVACLFDGSKEALLSIFEMMRRGCYVTVICKKKTTLEKLAALAKNYYVCDESLRVYSNRTKLDETIGLEGAEALVAPLWFKKIGTKELKIINKYQNSVLLLMPIVSLSKAELTDRYKQLNLKAKKAEQFLEICKNIYTSERKY